MKVKNNLKILILLILTFSTGWTIAMDTQQITFQDKVYKVRLNDAKDVEVLFLKHAAVYSLKSDDKNFNEIKSLVTKHQGTAQNFDITADADSLKIRSLKKITD